jgi:hypothetical protein
MPARSTAYYLLLKHTSQTVDSYCSFLDIHLLRTPPCYVQLALHLVEGRRATTGTYPSCQRCCAASKEVWGTSAEHSGKTQGARPCKDTPYLSCPSPHHPPSPLRVTVPLIIKRAFDILFSISDEKPSWWQFYEAPDFNLR